MFDNIKEFISESYNNMVINAYDAKHFEETNAADRIFDFSEEQILLADCWYSSKRGWWCSWNSDERLKENISDYSLENTDWIDNLQIKKYNYIGQNQERIGVIAQELEKIIPSATQTNDSGYKTIDLSRLLFMTIATLKELKDNIQELEKENIYLTSQLNMLQQQKAN
jgi:predicted class III extradiol MEMO1 family dioxygenase